MMYRAEPASATAIGRPIEIVRVQVDKQQGPIGVILESNLKAFPTVTSIPGEETHYDLQIGDIIAAVNGKPSHGAKTVARSIIRSKHTELEVWRPISRHQPIAVNGIVVPAPSQ